jgi:hypothetical protein
MHKEDLERGMLKQGPMEDVTESNRYQFRAQVDIVKSHFFRPRQGNIAVDYDLEHCESAAECLEFFDSLLADDKYLFALAERVEGGVCSPQRMQRVKSP